MHFGNISLLTCFLIYKVHHFFLFDIYIIHYTIVYRSAVQFSASYYMQFLIMKTVNCTVSLLIGWQAYRGDQIHRKNSPT